jgi:thioredoxin-related protein
MSKVYQRIELTANILVIIVALALGGILIQKYFLKGVPSKQLDQQQPIVGAQMALSDVNWSGQPKTLILALQTSCHFCNESAPFYKRILESVKNKNVKIVAVFPTAIEEGKAHLTELGLNNIEVKQSPLNAIQVSGTPTLILTNEKGEITDTWVGKLSPDKETEVLSKL